MSRVVVQTFMRRDGVHRDSMIQSETMRAALRNAGIDAIIATTRKNVFYTTGLWTTPTVTIGEENYWKTGRYTDFIPPKSLSVWTPTAEAPRLIVPPVVAMDIADENVDLDIPDQNVHVYEHKRTTTTDGADLDEHDRRTLRLLDDGYADRASALSAVLDPLGMDDQIALEETDGSAYIRAVLETDLDVDPDAIEDASRLLQELRLTKTDEEIDRLHTAATINETAITDAVAELEPDTTERELANTYKATVYMQGGIEQLPTDHTMIGFGSHTAYAHAVPGRRTLDEGDLIRFEVGCRYGRYASDLARTFAYKSVDPELERIYDVLRDGIDRGISLLAGGANAADVHESTIEHVRARARESGVTDLEDFTMNMIGHNIGLDIHDPPLLSPRQAAIEPGMVMNVELSHKAFGVGAVQIEDTALITDDGVERFTAAPEALPVVE